MIIKQKGVIKKRDLVDDDGDFESRELFAKKEELEELKEKAQTYHKLNINKVF